MSRAERLGGVLARIRGGIDVDRRGVEHAKGVHPGDNRMPSDGNILYDARVAGNPKYSSGGLRRDVVCADPYLIELFPDNATGVC